MCDRSPVRDALAKIGLRELESATGTARKRAAEAADTATADLFKRIGDDMEAELYDRLLAIATGNILRDSREESRRVRNLVTQMTS